MDELRVDRTILLGEDVLSVSYTRDLEHSGPEAARHAPTYVELRFDVPHCEQLTQEQRAALIAYPPLEANRRGTVRVFCREHKSRTMNLGGARQMLVRRIREVLFPSPDQEVEVVEPTPRKRGGGLIKKGGS